MDWKVKRKDAANCLVWELKMVMMVYIRMFQYVPTTSQRHANGHRPWMSMVRNLDHIGLAWSAGWQGWANWVSENGVFKRENEDQALPVDLGASCFQTICSCVELWTFYQDSLQAVTRKQKSCFRCDHFVSKKFWQITCMMLSIFVRSFRNKVEMETRNSGNADVAAQQAVLEWWGLRVTFDDAIGVVQVGVVWNSARVPQEFF